jgi:Icc-related predicted phosphoesterase
MRGSNKLFRGLALAALALITIGVAGCRSTGSSAPRDFTFVQLCDPQIGFKDYQAELGRLEQAVRQINDLQPDLVVVCGDMVNKPDTKSFADFNAAKAKLQMPVYCAPGNHDIGNAPTPGSLDAYRKQIGKDYYSFTHKGFVFVVANTQLWKTNLTFESEQHDAWFKRTLEKAAKKRQPIIVVCHYPPFEQTPNEPEAYFNLAPEKRNELLDLFQRSGVVAVLVGHAHKTLILEYEGIPIVASETTSENFDKRPYGFRVWRIGKERALEHHFVPLAQ